IDFGDFDSDVDELQGIKLDDFELDVDELLGIGFSVFDSDVDEDPLERVTTTRKTTRWRRLQRYQNYENIHHSGQTLEKEYKITKKAICYINVLSPPVEEGFMETRVSTLHVKDKLFISLDYSFVLVDLTEDVITTTIEIKKTARGALHFIASNNDSRVRDFDFEKF
ncbi:hypothetical protein H5410_041430, partial [Solanum commersonii]